VRPNFVQTITFRCTDPERLVELCAEWDRKQAEVDVMGYTGSHILAERERPGYYMIVAEFGVVDPNASAEEEAKRNNDRPETQEWYQHMVALTEGELVYRHYDEIYRTW
jgi:hypothetical protein